MTQNRVDTSGDLLSLLGLNLCRLKLVSAIQGKNITLSKQNSRLAPPLHHETGADAKMDGWMDG